MPPVNTLEALRHGDLAGARELRLPDGLVELPDEIFGLADTLEVLDLGRGSLTDLPAELGRLRKLRVLFGSGHRFERLPPVLGDCPELRQIGCRNAGVREVPGESLPPNLRWLTLTDNEIETLPAELGARPRLQKLMLAGNRLTGLPSTFSLAGSLELIRIAANRFERFPACLLDLPRLAWVAYAGNPCEPKRPPAPIAEVPWTDLHVGPRLGEGASGQIVEAAWSRDGAAPAPIAVKLFKGAMTSDGLPEREMAACLAAGAHPHLIGGLGRIVGHPEGVDGLLMPLLPSNWRALASPPSLESCSRDVYAPDARFDGGVIASLARAAASATAHLHRRQLLHGDLYAHNLLWDEAGGAPVLTDFGAASALPAGKEGEALQRIEVRAWGILLGELLERCTGSPSPVLPVLRDACLQPVARARPLMAEMLHALESAT